VFIRINVAIVFKKIFAIFIIKIRDFVVLITLDYLKFNENNLNIKFRNRDNEKKVSLKYSKFLSSFFRRLLTKRMFALLFISFVIFVLRL